MVAGGVSMGDRDWVKPLLEAKGTIHFGRVFMKPGKPLTFATLELPQNRQMLVFGLPGVYASVFCTRMCVYECECVCVCMRVCVCVGGVGMEFVPVSCVSCMNALPY